MNKIIGNKIKELRIKHSFTQEELAERLNISSQAVSKWENGNSLPDLSQIIPLVKIFGITSDELLGISDDTENEKVDAFIKECDDYIRDGHYTDKLLEVYGRCTDMLNRYPNNMRLLSYTIGYITKTAWSVDDTEEKGRLYKDAIRRANVVINHSRDISQIMEVKRWLVLIYCNLHEYDLARGYAEQFPEDFTYNRGIQLALVRYCEQDRGNEIKEYCNNIYGLIDTFINELANLSGAYMATDRYEDAVYTLETVLRLKDAIYRRDVYTPPMHRIASFYTELAKCYLHIGDREAAISYLEKGFEYVTQIEKYYNKVKCIDNPVLREKEFSFSDDIYFGRIEMKDNMNDPCFDAVREDERFVAVYERL